MSSKTRHRYLAESFFVRESLIIRRRICLFPAGRNKRNDRSITEPVSIVPAAEGYKTLGRKQRLEATSVWKIQLFSGRPLVGSYRLRSRKKQLVRLNCWNAELDCVCWRRCGAESCGFRSPERSTISLGGDDAARGAVAIPRGNLSRNNGFSLLPETLFFVRSKLRGIKGAQSSETLTFAGKRFRLLRAGGSFIMVRDHC